LPETPDQPDRPYLPAIIGAVTVLVVAALGTWGLTALARSSGGGASAGRAGATTAPGVPESTPTGGATGGDGTCTWTAAEPGNPNLKDVGTPPASGEPRSGTAVMTMTINDRPVEIAIDTARTPCTAASFAHLAGKKFFDGSTCHRLVNAGIFVLQCGDPSGTGSGGPTYEFADENLPQAGAQGSATYARGVVAMANRGPGTNGSQFFINFKDGELPPNYTPFGMVTKGMEVIDQIAAAGVEGGGGDGAPAKPVTVATITYRAP
jgi:peptidyl-prolyl cis-trans isomerase B (cyclophilin B)